MSDIQNREQVEKKIARALSKDQQVQLNRLIKQLGNPPNLNNIPQTMWDDIEKNTAVVLSPFLEEVFLNQAKEIMGAIPIGIDWTLINQGAVDWASRYSFDLVSHLNQTSRNGLSQAIQAYFRDAGTIGNLESRIAAYEQFTRRAGNLFGPVRAETIAITEVTRAAAQGEIAIAEDIKKQGIEMIATWNTNQDESTCPLCSPLNNKKQGDGWTEPPPLHPRCKCWLNHELPKVRRG